MERLKKVEVALVVVLLVIVTLPRAERPLTASELSVPTLVREELTTADPKVVASKTLALLMR